METMLQKMRNAASPQSNNLHDSFHFPTNNGGVGGSSGCYLTSPRTTQLTPLNKSVI